ncbi:substrate-binding periplasmic protein [Sneathiella aquimaris]|uniref:substrate-binding periplasmic protein n=1 Tax=Sneathiella aquimaris TaxID=2599305 RepID=UPI00146D91FC|nr:transporter substrate-binding domain-containing protein [Sneathiella aquimaris]
MLSISLRPQPITILQFLLIFLIGLALSAATQAKPLNKFQLITEHWAPYQYEEKQELKGYAVDVVVEILKRAGSSQTKEEIQLLPWARAYRQLETTKNTLLFSVTRTPERENKFKWVGPIFYNTTYLIALKDSHIKIEDGHSLNKYKFGTIRNDVSELYLKRYNVAPRNFSHHNDTRSNLEMLMRRRIDMIVVGWEAFKNDAQSLGLEPDNFEKVFELDNSEVSIAFHPETPNWIIARLQRTLDEIKSEGILEKFKQKYGIQEPIMPH